jgi:hypothetical protein
LISSLRMPSMSPGPAIVRFTFMRSVSPVLASFFAGPSGNASLISMALFTGLTWAEFSVVVEDDHRDRGLYLHVAADAGDLFRESVVKRP